MRRREGNVFKRVEKNWGKGGKKEWEIRTRNKLVRKEGDSGEV